MERCDWLSPISTPPSINQPRPDCPRGCVLVFVCVDMCGCGLVTMYVCVSVDIRVCVLVCVCVDKCGLVTVCVCVCVCVCVRWGWGERGRKAYPPFSSFITYPGSWSLSEDEQMVCVYRSVCVCVCT